MKAGKNPFLNVFICLGHNQKLQRSRCENLPRGARAYGPYGPLRYR